MCPSEGESLVQEVNKKEKPRLPPTWTFPERVVRSGQAGSGWRRRRPRLPCPRRIGFISSDDKKARLPPSNLDLVRARGRGRQRLAAPSPQIWPPAGIAFRPRRIGFISSDDRTDSSPSPACGSRGSAVQFSFGSHPVPAPIPTRAAAEDR